MKLPAARFVGSLGEEYLRAIAPITPEDVTVRKAPRLLSAVWGRTTGAMTLGSTVFVDPAVIERGGGSLVALLKHELVHARQWRDLGVVGFLLRYARQYAVARLTGSTHRQAYLAIDLEVEARESSSV